MFVVFLRSAANKDKAAAFMQGHKDWLQAGFDDGVFALAGSLMPEGGGAILVHGITRDDLEQRVQADPFVAEGIVTEDIVEIAPSRTDERLAFMAT